MGHGGARFPAVARFVVAWGWPGGEHPASRLKCKRPRGREPVAADFLRKHEDRDRENRERRKGSENAVSIH
jgi:hypothetical protein